MMAYGRDALGLKRVMSGHFADNPTSGRVLAKVGFRRLGETGTRPCLATGVDRLFVSNEWRG